jgi:hypothetical protein
MHTDYGRQFTAIVPAWSRNEPVRKPLYCEMRAAQSHFFSTELPKTFYCRCRSMIRTAKSPQGYVMHLSLLGVTLLQVSIAIADTANPVQTKKAACALVKSRVAELYNLPATGPPNLGWWCDFTSGWSDDLYVLGLRSGGMQSEHPTQLMGWYAVRKKTGEVGEFDIDTGLMKPLAPRP